jgi:beta-glucanase (GH16 family)
MGGSASLAAALEHGMEALRAASCLVACGVALGVAGCGGVGVKDALPPVPEGQVWKLVWHDEFDGRQLDQTKWEAPEHQTRDAWWTPRAAVLDGKGCLAIRIFQEGDRYYDAGLLTRGKFEHTFGYYVARIRLHRQQGHWGAFWLWNMRFQADGSFAPDSNEIDILERFWPASDDRVAHALHWRRGGGEFHSAGHTARVPGVGEGWHTFAVLWSPDQYVFYVDGQETWRTRDGLCQAPMYVMLSDEMLLEYGEGDIRKATLPDEFLVDYVRVYDLVDARSGQPVMRPPDAPRSPGG